MIRCQKCHEPTEKAHTFGDFDCLCRKCRKMMELEEERDWEDDPDPESESEE